MKKKLYYVVNISGSFEDFGFEATGWKNIDVYTIKNDTPQHFFNIEVAVEDNSKDSIIEWLEDNDMISDDYDIEEL